MRIRPALAAPAAALTVILSAPGATAAVSAPAAVTCSERAVEVAASASRAPHTVRISVTNTARRACVVDRVPTVTFGDLDGAAQTVPPMESAPYRLGAGRSAYAVVRTAAPGAAEVRRVGVLRVAGDPSHHGTEFTAASLNAPAGLQVWEPVTTLWQPSRAAADAASAAARGR